MKESLVKQHFSDEVKQCMLHFKVNVTRNKDNRFVVKLSFKDNYRRFSSSFSSSLRRFISLEKRLVQNPDLYTKCKKCMHEYDIFTAHEKYRRGERR